jgi:hypothetical protein
MSEMGEIHDPVLGVLRLEDEWPQCAWFRGEVDLTPKHRVVIEFQMEWESGTLEEGLDRAREAYALVREGEWDHRLAVARELLPDIKHFFDDEEGWTAERVARSLTLCRIDLHSYSVDWTLHYDSGGVFRDEPILVYFEEDGSIQCVEPL